jgi:ABC-2 type transport system ATP-binding protein
MSITPPDNAITVCGLRKVYAAQGKAPEKEALKSVDLSIPRGSMFALLGPNGAGKSTFINILAGLVIKSDGSAKVWDIDIDQDSRAARAAIGVVPQELSIDPFFTPREILTISAGLYGVPKKERRTDELLEAVGLANKADAYARTLSGGMRRRLMVAKAMVHNPPVLVLDEPTAGVDVELRQLLWKHVRDLNARGITIVLTTHYLEEAEELCDTIAIINQGDVVCCEPKETLLARLDSKTVRLRLSDPINEVPASLAAYDAELVDPHTLVLRYRQSAVSFSAILAALAAENFAVADLVTEEADLEDIFLQLTRRDVAA